MRDAFLQDRWKIYQVIPTLSLPLAPISQGGRFKLLHFLVIHSDGTTAGVLVLLFSQRKIRLVVARSSQKKKN